MADQIFLSYSREQLYFAESLALHLQDAGLSVWLDLQQLSPGSDWSLGIQAGLENCSAVLLVASQASLSSPYVAEEWKSALEASKPVYVVLFEEVAFPDPLKAAAVVDLRKHFDKGLVRLIDCISGERACQDPVPKPSRFGIPRQYPLVVFLVVATLLLTGINLVFPTVRNIISMLVSGPKAFFFGQLASNFPTAGIMGEGALAWGNRALFYRFLFLNFVFAGIGILYWYTGWRVLKRNFNYRAVRVALFAALFLPSFLGLLSINNFVSALFSPNTASGFGGPLAGVWQTGSIAVSCLNTFLMFWLPIIGYIVLGRSDSAYRWLPLNEASEKRRARHGKKFGVELSSAELEQQGKPIEYTLHAIPEDERVATNICKEMEKAGHITITSDKSAERALVLLSNKTPVSYLKKLVADTQSLIPILLTGVDVSEAIPEVSRYQWIDYRRQGKSQLKALAKYLRFPEPGRAAYGLSVQPDKLGKSIVPRRVFLFAMILRLWAILIIGLMVNQLVFQLELIPVPIPVLPYRLPDSLITVALCLPIIIGFLLIWIANLVLERRISTWLGLGSTFFSLTFDIVTLYLVTGNWFWPYRIVGFLTILFLLPAIVAWLPQHGSRRGNEPMLTVSSASGFWLKGLRDLAIVFILMVINVLSLIPRQVSVNLNDELSFRVPETWNTETVYGNNVEGAFVNLVGGPDSLTSFAQEGSSDPVSSYYHQVMVNEFADTLNELIGYNRDIGEVQWIAIDYNASLSSIVIQSTTGNAELNINKQQEFLEVLAERIKGQDASKGTAASSIIEPLEPFNGDGFEGRMLQVTTSFEKGGLYLYIRHWVVTIEADKSDYVMHIVQRHLTPVLFDELFVQSGAIDLPLVGNFFKAQMDEASDVTIEVDSMLRRIFNSMDARP